MNKKEWTKRFLTKDGKFRISIIQEDYAENPRDNTDEPFHCEDWSRNYSIMDKKEREVRSESPLNLIRYLLERYGNTDAIIKVLRDNAKADNHREGDNALTYDASRHEWVLNSWIAPWKDYAGEVHGNCWSEEWSFCCKINQITAYDIASYLSDDMVVEFAYEKYFTDEVKIGSYSFGYYGEISFSDSFSIDSDGICWLDKDEFLKYSGCSEDYWKSKSLTEIEWLCGEIKAWSENEVYGFEVEEKHRFKLHKEYIDEDKEDEDTEDEEWEETDSCWGFYGELDDVQVEYILDYAGYKIEELEEVA